MTVKYAENKTKAIICPDNVNIRVESDKSNNPENVYYIAVDFKNNLGFKLTQFCKTIPSIERCIKYWTDSHGFDFLSTMNYDDSSEWE